MQILDIQVLSNYTYVTATGYDAEEKYCSITFFIHDNRNNIDCIAINGDNNSFHKSFSRKEKIVIDSDTLRDFFVKTVMSGEKIVETC